MKSFRFKIIKLNPLLLRPRNHYITVEIYISTAEASSLWRQGAIEIGGSSLQYLRHKKWWKWVLQLLAAVSSQY
jgi:hypothetical protein